MPITNNKFSPFISPLKIEEMFILCACTQDCHKTVIVYSKATVCSKFYADSEKCFILVRAKTQPEDLGSYSKCTIALIIKGKMVFKILP